MLSPFYWHSNLWPTPSYATSLELSSHWRERCRSSAQSRACPPRTPLSKKAWQVPVVPMFVVFTEAFRSFLLSFTSLDVASTPSHSFPLSDSVVFRSFLQQTHSLFSNLSWQGHGFAFFWIQWCCWLVASFLGCGWNIWPTTRRISIF